MADSAKPMLKTVRTKTLEIAYEESGPENGSAGAHDHGFPYDPRAYDGTGAAAGRGRLPRHRPLSARLRPDAVPVATDAALRPAGGRSARISSTSWTRCNPTRLLVGFEWGGRGACVVSALWPERVRGLVTAGGYNIQNIAGFGRAGGAGSASTRCGTSIISIPSAAASGLNQEPEMRWCKLLWQLWSPTWKFDDATYQRSVELVP